METRSLEEEGPTAEPAAPPERTRKIVVRVVDGCNVMRVTWRRHDRDSLSNWQVCAGIAACIGRSSKIPQRCSMRFEGSAVAVALETIGDRVFTSLPGIMARQTTRAVGEAGSRPQGDARGGSAGADPPWTGVEDGDETEQISIQIDLGRQVMYHSYSYGEVSEEAIVALLMQQREPSDNWRKRTRARAEAAAAAAAASLAGKTELELRVISTRHAGMIKIMLSVLQSLVQALCAANPALEAQRVDTEVIASPVGPLYAVRDARKERFKGLLTMVGPLQTRSVEKILELLEFAKGISPAAPNCSADPEERITLVVGEEESWHVFLLCEKLRVFRYQHTLPAAICQPDDAAAVAALQRVTALVFDVFGEEQRQGSRALWQKLERSRSNSGSGGQGAMQQLGPKRFKSVESLA